MSAIEDCCYTCECGRVVCSDNEPSPDGRCDDCSEGRTTLHTFADMEQRSDEWYAARCGIVTASVVGKLLTPTLKVADNDTSRGITAALVAERITGIVEPTFMNDDMWRGVEHEVYARDVYSSHYQQAVTCGFMVRRGDDWALGFSPDGLVADDGLLEVKCPRPKGHVQTILSGEIPAHYMAQCQAGLLVSGRKWLDYVSFNAGMPLFVRRVHPDQKWFDAITGAAKKFETEASAMVDEYAAKAKGLPPTERIDLELVV